MSYPAVLVALAVLLGAAAIHEAAGSRFVQPDSGRRRSLVARLGRLRLAIGMSRDLGIGSKLRGAGLAERYSPGWILALKLVGGALGLVVGLNLAGQLSARIAIVVTIAAAIAGFLAPDHWLERRARLRSRQIEAVLPDLIDLLGVAAGSGSSPVAALGAGATHTPGPLGSELAILTADLDCGIAHPEALASLVSRTEATGTDGLVAAIERSRRYGSPLADQLAEQASTLRARRRRRVEEAAQKAAPKIQLVVALVLVPGVLLMIAAVLLSNSDALLGGL